MESITIDEICRATSGRLVAGDGEAKVDRINTDSRTLAAGDFFIALRGKRYDGHDYLENALEHGAAGIMYDRAEVDRDISRRRGGGASLVAVPDTTAALLDLAHWHRKRFSIPLVAVTGSNGKTTTKEMIRTAASGSFSALASEGTFNNRIGVPLTLLKLDRGHSLAVLEIGMNARGEIARLAAAALPTIGVVTNVGPAHLEFLGSVENVAAAKEELLEVMAARRGEAAVLNIDDPLTARMAGRNDLEIRTFGIEGEADVKGERVRAEGAGMSFRARFRTSGEEADIELPVPGVHNVYNALAAAAVCNVLGVRAPEISERLKKFRPMPMRAQFLKIGGITVINDAYNANPASVKAAIEMLARMEVRGKRILVLGDMLELGKAGNEAHRDAGRFAESRGIDVIIAVGDKAALAVEAAREAGMDPADLAACKLPEDAAGELERRAVEGDYVLLKASRRVGLEKIAETRRNRK